MADLFYDESKNYHAWSYRLWLVERFQLWEGELDFIEEELEEDVTNNTLWTYRYFLTVKTQKPLTLVHINHELHYSLRMIEKDYFNEAAWTYLRGWLAVTPEEAEKSKGTNAQRYFIGDFKWLKAEIN